MDGCVYLRDNEEYCFVQKSTEEGATVVCEAASSPFFTGSSTPPMSPVTGGQTGSTPTGSTDGTTGSLDDLTSRANEAHEKKDAAEAAIANAEAAKAAAEDVSNKLNDLDMSKFVTGRFRRQDASTTTIYPTPANCNDLKSTMTDLTNAMDSSSPGYDTAKAVAIVAILATDITLNPRCSSSDVADLNSAKDAAKNKADAVVIEQTNLISAKTEELNALVLEIQSLNEQIIAAGGTTIDPGTTAQTVPTVATGSASTGSTPAGSTPGSSAGSTPGSSPGSTPESTPTGSTPTGSTPGSSPGSTQGSTPTGSTPTGSTPGSSGGSTSGSTAGSTPGSTGTTVAPTTESVAALSQKAEEAAATKAAAVAAIAAAAETKAAAESVNSDLASITPNDFVSSRRMKRQATTTTYAKPSNCAGA